MAEVIWTKRALYNLDAIADYISLDNEAAAGKLILRIVRHVKLLEDHPLLGSKIPELKKSARYRQLVEPPCRIFFRYDKLLNKIFVISIIRGEQQFRRSLLS